LFWLGRTVAELEEYDGPQLDLELFKKLMEGKVSLKTCVAFLLGNLFTVE